MAKATLPKYDAAPIVAGMISGGLFLVVTALGMGFFFLFLPTLPIFFMGLKDSSRKAWLAAIAALLLITIVAGPAAGIMFFVFLGLPAWYISRYCLFSQLAITGEREWFPVGLIFLNLTLYACAVSGSIVLYYAGEMGGIEKVLSTNMQMEFSNLQDEYEAALTTLINQWAFLIFSMTMWLWGLVLYVHAWLAQRILVQQKKTIRPNLAITLFAMPHWVLYLVAVCALASLIGSPSMQFFGKSSLIALLFPYCLLGGAIMHAASKAWPSRRFFLFFVYFFIFAQFWPALILSGVGIWHHIKGLSGLAGSSKR